MALGSTSDLRPQWPHFHFLILSLIHLICGGVLGSQHRSHTNQSTLLLLSSSNPALLPSALQAILESVDKLQQLDYGEGCDSFAAEKARHDLTQLIARASSAPSPAILREIQDKEREASVPMCHYARGLACSSSTSKCICYNGHRHGHGGSLAYEPIREDGACRLDEMSPCYSPSYLVSRGALVIHCIHGAKCVGDRSGRRCVDPGMEEDCHCQRPCPDGSFTNLEEELGKCLRKLGQISVLPYNEPCEPGDQGEMDEVLAGMLGKAKAGPIIRGIKRLLGRERMLCSAQDKLVCGEGGRCECGPEKDGFKYERGSSSNSNSSSSGNTSSVCLWAKGSRCFPLQLGGDGDGNFTEMTAASSISSSSSWWGGGGGGGGCVEGTLCLQEGDEVTECSSSSDSDGDDGSFGKVSSSSCFCQDPEEKIGAAGLGKVMIVIVLILVGSVVLVGGLVHTRMIRCPPGAGAASV